MMIILRRFQQFLQHPFVPVIVIMILFTVIVATVGYFAFRKVMKEQSPDASRVCIVDQCFDVEVADTEQTRTQGLMYRSTLAHDKGMLFVFEQEGLYPFWMKNTKIPLDMIWIDSGSRIVDIQTASPCTADPCPNYTPSGTARYVLEINAGLSQNYRFSTGDTIQIYK